MTLKLYSAEVEKTRQMKSKENQREKDIRQYLRNVAKALPPKGRKTLLSDIRSGVASYLAENPQATLEDVAAYVGTPECIANEYYANQDGRKITQENQREPAQTDGLLRPCAGSAGALHRLFAV